MFDRDDEELARTRRLGSLTHDAIASLASCTRSPSISQITEAATAGLSHFRPIEARAHRQLVIAGTACYFTHLLPSDRWHFGGSEVHLGSGRVDILWKDMDGFVLLDEVKTGSPRQLRLAKTTLQVSTYLSAAVALWSERFIGVRLLCTVDPFASLFVPANGPPRPLHDALDVA